MYDYSIFYNLKIISIKHIYQKFTHSFNGHFGHGHFGHFAFEYPRFLKLCAETTKKQKMN